ncbi:Transposase [Paenibacillus sp. yr247]|uniref:IS110 family transposase n=1 Tax=Paenibacillus sp. yr247 TaxID=1761880 RepID=UPI0008910CD6|nr:transposase [Paenibacillus sp. yr247]SDP08083.1 Transposase [Paenibacillus sp. yr247]
MDIINERACTMDVHKDSITVCTVTSEGKEIQTFSIKPVFLLQLIDWIKKHGCTHVALESTGIFWKEFHKRHAAQIAKSGMEIVY